MLLQVGSQLGEGGLATPRFGFLGPRTHPALDRIGCMNQHHAVPVMASMATKAAYTAASCFSVRE